MVGDTQLQPFSLADIFGQAQQYKLRQTADQRAQQEMQHQQALLDRQQQEWGKADTAEANTQAAVKLASTGDYAGAESQYGLGAGNLDIHGHIAGLQDAERQQIATRIRSAVPIAIQALQTPDPQARAALIHANAQGLINAGWKPEDIAAFQPTDENLKGLIESSRTADEALKLYDARTKPAEPFTLGQDQQRYDGAGNLIASGPESIKAVNTPEGSTTTIFGGAGHTGISGGQRYVNGWSPRARNGGDNSDASVDNYISHVAQTLGVDPNAPLPRSAIPRLAAAMAQFESGGSPTAISNRNNNPGNIKAAGGGFRKFDTPQQGQAAMQGLLARYMARGQTTIKSIIEGVPAKSGGPMTIKGQPKPEDAATPLDAQGLEFVAQQVANGGDMPALGMGKQAAVMRAKIISRAAQIAKGNGLSGADMPGVIADRKANAATLTTLTRMNGQVLQAEGTASRNADQVLRTMDKGAAGSGVPILNAWIQHGRSGVGGSPDVAAFDVAINTLANEYAKVITSSSGGGGVTSDSARHEAMALINRAMTPTQLRSVITQMRTDMGNRKAALTEQINATKTALRAAGSGNQGGGNVPTMTPEQARSAPKGTRFRTTDGRVLVRQ